MRLLRLTAYVLALIVVFDIVGVLLTVGADLLGLIHRTLETSSPLAYVIWFVTGTFCSLAIYGVAGAMDDSAEAGQRGWQAARVTMVCAALALGVSSRFWVAGHPTAVAPDSAAITLTYLVTIVFGVVWWRVGVFSGSTPVRLPAGPLTLSPSRSTLSSPTTAAPTYPVARTPQPPHAMEEAEPPPPFRRAGVPGTIGWILGMPVLLFLGAAIFVLAPFNGLMRPWTDPILTGALLTGPVWGLLAALWQIPREAVLALHAPVLVGSVCWFMTALIASPLVGVVGLPDRVASVGCAVAFFAGFLLGMGALVGWVAEVVERRRRVRSTPAGSA